MTITAGALAAGCNVPDAGTASPSGFGYNITICDTSVGNPSSGQCATLAQVHGVTGATWQLDHYSALSSVSTVGAFTLTLAVGAPTGTGGTNALYADITTPTAPVLWLWTGSAWAQLSGAGGSVTATAIQTALASRTGCNQAGYPYVPQSNNCQPQTGGFPAASSIGTLYGFGDSTMASSYASSGMTGAFSILARDWPGPSVNNGYPGAYQSAISNMVFTLFGVQWTGNQVPVIFSQGGINDANIIGNTTGGINNYKLELGAAMYWASLPLANKLMASTATASGFAASYSGASLIGGLPGSAKQSTTNGDTLTFSITPTGTKIGVTYSAFIGGGGTFSIKIDGTSQTDLCSGTTTFTGAGCNSAAVTVATFFRQEFTVTAGTAHTVLITVTSATGAGNPVAILDADSTTASKLGWLHGFKAVCYVRTPTRIPPPPLLMMRLRVP